MTAIRQQDDLPHHIFGRLKANYNGQNNLSHYCVINGVICLPKTLTGQILDSCIPPLCCPVQQRRKEFRIPHFSQPQHCALPTIFSPIELIMLAKPVVLDYIFCVVITGVMRIHWYEKCGSACSYDQLSQTFSSLPKFHGFCSETILSIVISKQFNLIILI